MLLRLRKPKANNRLFTDEFKALKKFSAFFFTDFSFSACGEGGPLGPDGVVDASSMFNTELPHPSRCAIHPPRAARRDKGHCCKPKLSPKNRLI
jgi:hypothetical protein